MDPDFFAPLSLSMDASTKLITSPDATLKPHLDTLNATHRALQQIDPPSLLAPPPPVPVNPKRSQQVAKLREAAAAALLKKQAVPSTTAAAGAGTVAAPSSDAIRLYTVALEMAQQRPAWEPAGLLREEVAAIYAARAGAYMAARAPADAWVDAQASVEAKRGGNPQGWKAGGRALAEMGRRGEAREWLGKGMGAEEAAVEQLRAQVNQLQQGHPGLGQAREGVRGLEREVEEMREMAKGLGAAGS